mmetsp:Transcript_78837/g.156152  ORF Transcript_78837/g.156152 Transcript_78837/m.156152 type:complete len:91 (-) Transcript_78837:466-738(-)
MFPPVPDAVLVVVELLVDKGVETSLGLANGLTLEAINCFGASLPDFAQPMLAGCASFAPLELRCLVLLQSAPSVLRDVPPEPTAEVPAAF